MEISVQPIILSGGSGTRLWPLSREAYPKQFWPLVSADSLLVETALRIHRLDSAIQTLAPMVVCNESHRFLVAEQLRLRGFEDNTIVLEPFARNTAPALTLAALLTNTDGFDPVLVVLPSDHLIQNESRFRKLLVHACKLAHQGQVVTFGIVPSKPETGFGYLQVGNSIDEFTAELTSFIEKPDSKTAQQYLSSGNYLWNSGIFVMRASIWIRELQNHCSKIYDSCVQAKQKGAWDGPFFRAEKELFSHCPKDSIDKAVMEKLVQDPNQIKISVIPMDVGWSDLGSWGALKECQMSDEHGNVKKGDVFSHCTKNSLLYSQSRFLASVGIDNAVVIETADAVLVANKEYSQEIKQVTEYLQESGRSEHVFHNQIHRPWGSYEQIDQGEGYLVKRLTVNPGESLTLQLHHHRAEHWIVVKGTAKITRGTDVFLLAENESTFIPVGEKHCLENPGKTPLKIIEVQSGSQLNEEDVIRFELQ